MKILITGHMGFVGKYFMKKYKDHDITGIDIKEGNDCRDFFKTSNEKFDLVIHLAAIVGGRQTIDNNPLSVAIDLSIDAELSQWALRTKPTQLIYFSSSAAYPIELQKAKNKRCLHEKDINLKKIKNPDMTYGWAKLTGEYLMEFLKNEGIQVYVFRPFTGYGSDQDLDYPFPSYIKRAAERQDPFIIWGDGNQVRDFIHIEDVVNAVHATVSSSIYTSLPINLGWGVGVSFNELCALVTRIEGYSPKIVHQLSAPIGVQYRVCDPSRMTRFYTPQITLQEGVERALRDFKS
jgi:nucleoside-diphosphate-sugar epimerase